MRNLTLSSLLLLLLNGCSLSLINNFKASPLPAVVKLDSCSWFRQDTGHYLFQGYIDIFRNNYSGLLFVKPLDDSHRVLFITETGIKIFDMEFFRKGDFSVHYCLKAINRKSVINTLGNDFSLMLYNIPENSKINVMEEKGTGNTIIKGKGSNGTRYCKINKETGKFDELIRTGTFSNKMNIRFFSASGIQPDSIIISHYNLKLKIYLARLNEN